MNAPLPPPQQHPAIAAAHGEDETVALTRLIEFARQSDTANARIGHLATWLAGEVRRDGHHLGMVDAFLQEFGLGTDEGVALMCLAEALLRIPDDETADALIRDKLTRADWSRHLGHADNLLVNASTWALTLTGRLIGLDRSHGVLHELASRTGEPAIRRAMVQAMRLLGHQFVMGRNIDEALTRARDTAEEGWLYSFDMLGEGARTAADASTCFDRYLEALTAIGNARHGRDLIATPSLSVKLSALHPRFEEAQGHRVRTELVERLSALCRLARTKGVALTIDAEESDRLEVTLDALEAAVLDPGLPDWDGLGLAVQAYQKRAPAVIDWIYDLSRRTGRRLMVRLVKGAYWDSEIKKAQERGLAGYPVFTRKVNTDVSYLACAHRLLAMRDRLYPMFATHNAHTVAAILTMAGEKPSGFEFQRLHGMGEPLYRHLADGSGDTLAPPCRIPCRVYAPVGGHADLLCYLARRLLENGANTSFVNRLRDEAAHLHDIVADPVAAAARNAVMPHPRIALPRDLFGSERRNSQGFDLTDRAAVATLYTNIAAARRSGWIAAPLIAGHHHIGLPRPVLDPADRTWVVGERVEARPDDADRAISAAAGFAPDWDATPATVRADMLDRAAGLIEVHRDELVALLVHEGGKTIPDAIAEVREAADFCRYYGGQARTLFGPPQRLPGPTGERNELSLHGRGVFACIGPWNFPLAIFTGQIAAALAAGNCAIGKPAPQTPLIAARAVGLLREAGIPEAAVQLLPGDGAIGAALAADPRVGGIAFTGSTATARSIAQTLAARPGAMVPLIAETGGLNAMIADSSALTEQLVDDVIASAFRSAGQRCSALRVLFLPDSSATKVLEMLEGAAAELRIGNPARLDTDIGPIIDEPARHRLQAHADHLSAEGRLLFESPLPDDCGNGFFFAPRAFELDDMRRLTHEPFGPILHVVRYAPGRVDQVLAQIDACGYGLTLGVHSRIDSFAETIRRRVRVGNVYVNRNMIGAVVGAQPFGGEGMSGTGFKAGGPHYLLRFGVERCYTVNAAAAGGNAALVSLDDAG